jgi:hypothetical protein
MRCRCSHAHGTQSHMWLYENSVWTRYADTHSSSMQASEDMEM